MSFTLRRGIYLALLAAATAIALLAFFSGGNAVSQGGGGNSGYERVYAANFTTYGDPPELVTAAPPAPGAEGGTVIYSKDFFVADDINTLFVHISATGDTHDGARLQLACKVDGRPCNAGANPVGGSPSGWVTLSRHENYNDDYTGPGYAGDGGGGSGDVHDNTIMKEWCAPFETKAGTHNVEIRMASTPSPDDGDGPENNQVFMEAVDFKITGARIADQNGRCTRQQPPATTEAAIESLTEKSGDDGH